MSRPFSYPRAGQGGVPGVAREVEDLLEDAALHGVPLWRLGPSLALGFFRFFRRLPKNCGLDRSQVPGLYLLLGSGTNSLKMDRTDAAYQGRPVGNQSCRTCSSSYRQIVTGNLVCSQIQGAIIESGYCRLWNLDRN